MTPFPAEGTGAEESSPPAALPYQNKPTDSQNKGYQMLRRMGWNGMSGLGKTETGALSLSSAAFPCEPKPTYRTY